MKMYQYIASALLLAICFGDSFGQRAYYLRDSTETPMVELGEVNINASRHNFKLKEMPASVSVLSSKNLSRNQVNTLNDISSLAPGFFMPDYGSKLTSPVYIRGIGSRINAPSVGLYVDQVPYFEKAAFSFDFFDIERVEILRGPQGTLYGRNTMGGIINIITRSPIDYQGTQFNASAGNFGSYVLNAGHYAKPSNAFAYSLALNFQHNNGYYTNHFDNSKVDVLDSYGFRNRLFWKASERLSIENIASFELSRQGGYPYAILVDSTQEAREINYNQFSSYNRTLFSNSLVFRYEGNSFEIAATSSYQNLNDLQSIDQDFTPDSIYFVKQDQLQNMLSQEVIVRSRNNNKFKWLFGAFSFYQEFNNRVVVNDHVRKVESTKQYDHKIMGYALFHQTSLQDVLIEGLSVSAGIRLDTESDKLDYKFDVFRNNVLTPRADTTYPALTSFEVLPKVSLNYSFGRSNLYALIARGYKTGGFNSTFENAKDHSFKPEYSWNYEAGIKTPLPGNKVFADLSLFYIDWKDQQIYQPVVNTDGLRIGSMLKNAGHSASKGVETTFRANTWQDIETTITYSYTYATFLSHVVDSGTNYNGNYIPYVPKHTFALQLGKTFYTGQSSWIDRISINTLYRGAGAIYWNERNDAKEKYYGLFDAKVSFHKDALSLDFWIKNLLNTQYHSYYFEAFNNKYVQMGKPQRFGLNISYKF